MAKVLIYDSLTEVGHIAYANALTRANKPLFDACDGIFLNYWCARVQRTPAHYSGRRRRRNI